MMPSSSGLFVSVDGPSGVGKSTTVRALAQLLREEGCVVHETAEPSDGPIGQLGRELTETVHGLALACLYAADRYHHLTSEVLPHLKAGEADAHAGAARNVEEHNKVIEGQFIAPNIGSADDVLRGHLIGDAQGGA
jgi:energy-coupling factor transporter ATP-binding protein EcfA2